MVFDEPGTTRDSIYIDYEREGQKYTLIDTAGVRESKDEIEREGIAMTHGQVAKADLILEMRDLSEPFEEVELPIPEGAKHLQIFVTRS